MTVRVLEGDARQVLAALPDASMQCCVTSPPYFGLRDYGHARQIGLEPTPEAYVAEMVAVFREVRRVLREDGTLWLNLGDSYAAQRGGTKMPAQTIAGGVGGSGDEAAFRGMGSTHAHRNASAIGLKHKDLLGIPWRVAFALQQPYYAGTIRREIDRVWLAAMIDAEGCMFIHRRKAGTPNGQGYERQSDTFSAGMEVSNTHRSIIERIVAITGRGSVCEQAEGRRQTLYRWNLRSNECRDVIREVYPYLVGKQHQARIVLGCPSSGERATAAWMGLKALHAGSTTDVDFPSPSGMDEPGWYLRSDVIWSKLNPMPESVTDRPTKAHEYVFLLTKSARYYYDAGAIDEPLETSPHAPGNKASADAGHLRNDVGTDAMQRVWGLSGRRNARSVWPIATQPFKGAHFATMPPALAERCVKAGTKRGDMVLDPFGGAGTTGLVADRLGRDATLIELNPTYAALARQRIKGDNPLMGEVV